MMRLKSPALFVATAVFCGGAHAAQPTTPTTATATPATTTTAPAAPTVKIIAPAGTTAAPAPTPATTAAPTGKDTLLLGQAALRAGLASKCIELSKEAARSGTLDDNDLAAAWLLRGRCHALDGDADRAERSYAVATRIKPTLTVPAKDTIWERVQPEGSAAATALVLIAAGVVIGEHEVGLEVTTQDDLVLGATIVVVDENGVELARAPTQEAPPPATTTTPPTPTPPPPVRAVRHRFSGFSVKGTTTKLLDRNGNLLRAVAVELDERATLALSSTTASTPPVVEPAPVVIVPRAAGPLTYVGAGVAVVGLVGTAVCGINLSSTARENGDGHDGEFPFVVGAIAGAGVMVVGMGLIVADGL